MQIRHVRITNFRGIRHMEWSIHNPIVCHIGPGDSTKSTTLDAIECVLTPHWNMTFDDSDFYSGATSCTYLISCSVTYRGNGEQHGDYQNSA